MGTKKLFWEDAYLREFDAKVLSSSEVGLILDQSAFNPRGGGLVGDTGYLDAVRVMDTVKEGDTIVHKVESYSSFTTGQQVHARLDWERRYRIMRMHTSAHILSAIFHVEAGALITGNQIEPERSRIDFNLETFDKGFMVRCAALANDYVRKKAEVKTYFMPRDDAMKIPNIVKLAEAMPPEVKELRIVEIVGLDIQADGGPHIRNVGEVGEIQIVKSENKGKNNRRIYFSLVP